MTNFRLFQTQRVCRSLINMAESYPNGLENTVEKGEIVRCKQFLLFPQCFQKTCNTDT